MGHTLPSGLVSGYIDDEEVPVIMDSFKNTRAMEPAAKPAAVAAINPKLQMRSRKDEELDSKKTGMWGKNDHPIVGSVDQTINSHRISYLINHGSGDQSGHHKDVYGSSDSSNDSD